MSEEYNDKSPAEKRGYKAGDKFKIVSKKRGFNFPYVEEWRYNRIG